MPDRSATTPRSEALVLVGLLLLIAVLGVWPGGGLDIRAGKQALVENWLLVCAAWLIRSRPLRYLCWWVTLSFVLHYQAESMVTAWRVLLGCLTIEMIAASEVPFPRLLQAWRWLTLLHTGYCLLQWAGLDPFFRTSLGQGPALAGFLDNETTCMTYTALTLPLFGTGWWRLAWGPTVVLLVRGHSEGALLVAAVLLLVMTWRACREYRGAVVALLCGGLAIYSATVSPLGFKLYGLEWQGNRVPVWREAVRQTLTHPVRRWLGSGPGQFGAQFKWRANPALPKHLRWDLAQNESVNTYYELGPVGLALALWAAWTWLAVRGPDIVVAWQLWLAWLLGGLYLSVAHLTPLVIVGIVSAGVLEGARRRELA